MRFDRGLFFWHSVKTHFAVCRKIALGKIHLCRVPEKKALDKDAFYRVFFFAECILFGTRQRERLYRVSDKIHSAKPQTLDKIPVSCIHYFSTKVNE